jgi:hypothetical protein
MVLELVNLRQMYENAASLSLLFGVQLRQIIEVFDRFIDVQVTLLPGLTLTMLGLVLLIFGGAGRLLVAVLGRPARAG